MVFMFILVLGTSVWVLVDGYKYEMDKNESPVVWFIGCLLLWIVAFPWYVVKRSNYKLKNNSKDEKSSKKEKGMVRVSKNNQSIVTRQIRLLPFIGTLMIIGGIVAVIYFAIFFDTSVAIPTTEIFGQTIGGGRVNNLGLMNDRSNGIMIGIGAAIFGLILSIVAKSKSKA